MFRYLDDVNLGIGLRFLPTIFLVGPKRKRFLTAIGTIFTVFRTIGNERNSQTGAFSANGLHLRFADAMRQSA